MTDTQKYLILLFQELLKNDVQKDFVKDSVLCEYLTDDEINEFVNLGYLKSTYNGNMYLWGEENCYFLTYCLTYKNQ